MDNVKGLFQSKIFWTQIFGLVVMISGAFGLTSVVGIFSDPALADKAVMIVGVGVQVLTILLRKSSSTPIVGLVQPQ